ncbi:MAG: hypothetical protein NXI32_16705 [bacterium]|nr:hypothetical protein [bacterium]
MVRSFSLLTLTFAFLWTTCAAQETGAGNARPTADRFPDVLGEGTLPLDAQIYLLDENGERVFVPNMSMKELLRLRELATGNTNAFQFEQILIDADVIDDAADVTGKFTILLQPGLGVAEVPLRFGTCQLGLEKPIIDSDPDIPIDGQFMADSTGYRWIVASQAEQAESPSSHSITLRGKTRISQDADRRTLRIALPQQACKIRIRLPANAIDERIRAEDYYERSVTQDAVELSVSSRGGDFEVSWRTQQPVNRVATVEAQSQTTFTIGDPRDLWNASTRLTVRWYGTDASDTFRIKLPDRARWRTFPEDDFERYKISSQLSEAYSPSADASGIQTSQLWDQDSAELVVVNLDPRKNRLIELPLEWEWMPESFEQPLAAAATVPNLTVEDVNLHRGMLNVVCPSSYLVVFREGSGVQLIQRRRLTDAFASQQLQFKFDEQDFDLNLEFRREQALPTVRPTYHVSVDENKLVMTAWLDCSFDANQRPHELGMIFGNWIPQDNTARVLSANAGLFSDEGELLRVEPQNDGSYRIIKSESEAATFASGRRVQQIWRVVAERAWRPDENQLQFDVPSIIRARGSSADHGSGVLIVSSTDQILLQWQETPFRGLLPDSFSSDYERFVSSEPSRKPLAYRFQSQGDTPAWAGAIELLPQAIATNERVEIRIDSSAALVQQDLQLQIANVPLERPQIAVRSDASQLEPQFLVNGILTTARLLRTISTSELIELVGEASPSGAAEGTEYNWNVYQLVGASPLQRTASLSVATTLSWQPPAAQAVERAEDVGAVDLNVPLAQFLLTKDARMLERSLQVQSRFQLSFADRNESVPRWQPLENNQRISLGKGQQHVALRVQLSPDQTQAPTVVTTCWLQTAVNNAIRQDRFVAKFTSTASELRMRLPAFASVRPAPVILLDGVEQEAATYRADEDVFIVPIENTGKTEQTLEVIYSVLSNLENWTTVEVAIPEVLGAEFTGRFYWQLATPRTQHLAWSPSSLTPEWKWRWDALFWHRESSRTESQLVQELGASDSRIPSSANTYLMSGQTPRENFQVLILARYLLWFPIGTLAILIATLVANYPFFRSPLAGMLAALLIAGAAMAFPDLGVMLGQAAAMALGLVAMVFAVNAAIESRVRRRSVFTARPANAADNSDQYSANRSTQATATTAARRGSSIIASGGKP